MRLDVDVYGEKLVARELVSRAERLEHPWPFFNAAANFLIRVERAQFATDGMYASAGWEALDPDTIRRKARLGMPDPERPLHGWGLLERSLTERSSGYMKLRITDNELVFGSKLKYLVYHQSIEEPRTHLPRRAPLALTTMGKKHIERGATYWVSRGKVWPSL